VTLFPAILEFSDEYEFLSNFYRWPVFYRGITYVTSEHAYQAAKAIGQLEHDRIAQVSSPGKARKLGQDPTIRRPDWEHVKVDIMLAILRAKFRSGPLRMKLLDTGDAHLEEGNHWGDKFWGTVDGKGENWLGRLLMQVREELRRSENA
jgi:ribA/ribD-fused uncharacterized protein